MWDEVAQSGVGPSIPFGTRSKEQSQARHSNRLLSQARSQKGTIMDPNQGATSRPGQYHFCPSPMPLKLVKLCHSLPLLEPRHHFWNASRCSSPGCRPHATMTSRAGNRRAVTNAWSPFLFLGRDSSPSVSHSVLAQSVTDEAAFLPASNPGRPPPVHRGSDEMQTLRSSSKDPTGLQRSSLAGLWAPRKAADS